jgi:metal-sulfur cluster biosynthetic enzyme
MSVAVTGAPGAPADARAAEVLAALDTVIDPELDEPITDLGFVTDRVVDGGRVSVRLRLPTAFCSPNFAYLMVSDAHDALSALPWVETVQVLLQDHHDAEQINRGVAAGLGFAATYPQEAAGELDALRRVFRVKAHTAFIERVCRLMLSSHGWEVGGLGTLRLGDVPAGRPRDGLYRRRADLGLTCRPDDPVMVDDDGRPWDGDQIPLKLRFAKSVRISIDGNAHFCRGLLRTRYPDAAGDQQDRAHESLGTDLGLPAFPARRPPMVAATSKQLCH